MNSPNYLVLLHFSLILVTAAPSRNVSSVTPNRVKRLSNANYDEQSFRLAPMMVSIRTRSVHRYFGDNHFCSGVIVSPTFVLTSAHCLINNRRVLYSSQVLTVVAATVNRLKYMSKRTFITPVDSMILPDNFSLLNKQDVAILKMATEFPRNHKFISVAKLPIEPPKVGLKCFVPGWGRMFRGGPLATHLLYINVEIIDRKICAKRLNVRATDLLCAEDTDPLSSQQPCGGDWGSPLIHENTVYGLVSFLVGCGIGKPSVYTDIYASLEWIEGKIVSNRGSIPYVPVKLEYFLTKPMQTGLILLFVVIYETLEVNL
ncbi:chymotrypsin-2 isoform X2 [Drosophila biarmipes]|uniref:chymotrypsin-2 isoform X2 n=1 Tax=Drosophila biarmipes TaxID=125945 RepID=UPI0007E673F2|nr:chymotrypsin-2 isoform X2 [Drosophila biarmipes]